MSIVQQPRITPTPSFSMPFYQRPSQSAVELRTPPASPPDLDIPTRIQMAKFRLPRILKKNHPCQTPPLVLTRCSSSDAAFQAVPNTDDVPPLPRRGSSPFRAVSQMKEPFPFVLPASPPISPDDTDPKTINRPQMIRQCSTENSNNSSSFQLEANRIGPEPTRKLRMTPLSFPDLKRTACSTRLAPNATAPTLLPSPDFHDSPNPSGSNEWCFSFHSPYPTGGASSPYENYSIVSSYCDMSDTPDQQSSIQTQTIAPRKQTDDQQTMPRFEEPDMPQIVRATVKLEKRERPDRSSTFSSEGDWLAGTMQYCEKWLQGVETDQRRCHIVQNPESETDSDHLETFSAVKYATVIQTTKPKLVTISRPVSMLTEAHIELEDTLRRPKTPETYHEISAFSPWDSPNRSSALQPSPPRDQQYARATPVSRIPVARSTTRRPSAKTSNPQLQTRSLSINTMSTAHTTSPSPKDSEFSLPTSGTTVTSRSEHFPKNSPQGPSKISKTADYLADKEIWDRCNDLEWVLEHLSNAIDDGPSSVLRLYSPVIIHMRSPNSIDEILINALQKVFPSIEPTILSALAATIIAHQYVVRAAMPSPLCQLPSPTAISPHQQLSPAELSRLTNTNINTVAVATTSNAQIHERTLKRRAETLAISLSNMVDNLIFAVSEKAEDPVLRRCLEGLIESVEFGMSGAWY